jgi:hypothetical protein
MGDMTFPKQLENGDMRDTGDTGDVKDRGDIE